MIRQFEEHVQRFSEKTALCDPLHGLTVTYRELETNARRIAGKLAADGFAKGDRALITASRGIGYIEAIFGILMAGGVYVPLSEHYPGERIAFIKSDCGAETVLDDSYISDALMCEPVVPVETAPEDPALIIYTSGSSGSPKGTLHDVRSIKDVARRYHEASGMEADDIYGINAPFYFVAHLIDVFGSLLKGLTAVIVPEDLRGDPDGLANFIDQLGISMIFISPRVLRYFKKKGKSLRFVIGAGERMSGIAPDGFSLMNAYGMTETASLVTFFMVDRAYTNTPVGKPCSGIHLYLLDEEGHPSDEGEICLSGPLGRGYLNRPEETALTFTPNPFKETDGYDILIRTGDLGKRLPDGNYQYVNRKDWMIKINGQRVEPGEIEAALRRLDGISEAVVKDFTDASGQTFLAAYYVSDSAMDEEILRSALLERLPEYMVPSRFLRLEKLPLNANGKVDRKALPAPDVRLKRAAYVPAENDRQAKIVSAFEKVLGAEKIGIDDDFFSLGGDSIKVIMLQQALKDMDMGVTARSVFENRTTRALAKAVGQLSALSTFAGSKTEAYPLTQAQMSIYLDCQNEGRGTAYNNVFGLFLPADMNDGAEKLQAAAETVLNRYPILASVTKVVDGMPSLTPTGKKISVEIKSAAACEKETLAQSLNTPFDLEHDLPVRAAIFHTPEGLFLVLAMHHIVCDGTTASILLQNIAAAYNKEEIAPEGMSNLTLAQYEAEHTEEQKADTDVYRKMLDDMEGDTELYSDDDPALASYAGKLGLYETSLFEHQGELSGTLISKLSDHHITESTLFMSAYAYLLRLMCNQKGVLFFAGENGRHDPVLQNTVGMLVHNIPVFVNIQDDTDTAVFMDKTQSLFHELATHDSADFSGLYGEYGIHPDHFFVYQGDMLSGVELDGRFIPMEVYKSDAVMASMTLHVLKQKNGDYQLHFEYAAEKFSKDTIIRMAGIYTRIVAGLLNSGRLQDISLLDDETLAEMDVWNANEKEYPKESVVTQFRAMAEKYPDHPAVIYKNETLTYAQVDEISDRIAGKLRSLGIGRDDVVSILIPRCSYMTTASLGALKSGAAYQPLDSTYPADRLAFMMQDAGTKLLIVDETLISKAAEYKGPVLLTKDIPDLPPCESVLEDPAPSDAFILLYTSGSTGLPKGVVLEHHNISNFCGWYREFYHLDENCRVAAYASYGFDANMMDQYPALTIGASVVIIEEEIRLDLLALEELFNKQGITHSFMTTQVGRQFYSLASPKDLRYLSTGGEKLVPLPPREGGPVFYNLYGPSECTVLTTYKQVDRLYDRVPIGSPLTNYKCYVLDENGRRLPPLVPGELMIAGYGVGRGYLNRPELTEKVFIRNPFSTKEGFDHAYLSGDVVRLLPDGEIDFIGRNDGQVKVRGFRIELTEIEGVIREYPDITDATVQAFEDELSGEKYVAAYVVSPKQVDVSALNAFILERKPPYLVPAVTMQIDAIPLNQNQKVNKKALPKPERQKVETIPPQNEAQQKIFDCIAEVVGHKDFGITTNLFEAGLSSIGAIRLNVLLARAFDAPVSARDFRTHDTVEKLEAFISSLGEEKPLEILDEYPVTKTQEGIFIETEAHPDSTIYNIPSLIELDPSISIENLKAAVAAAVEAHPYIMNHFLINDKGELRQKREANVTFHTEEIGRIRCKDIAEVKDTLVKPFDLLQDRLYRFSLIYTPEKAYLFMDLHHIINDGVSQGILMRDISRAYAGETLTPEKYSGYEAALLEAQVRESEHYQEAKEYYTKVFGDVEPDCLPLGDVTDPCGDSGNVVLISDTDTEAIERYSSDKGLSLNAFYTAAFGYTVAKYCNRKDAVFTTINNGRGDPRFADSVSMFVKTYPVLCKTEDQPVRDYIEEVASQLMDSLTYDVYSFAEISHDLGISADLLFAYQGAVTGDDTFCGVKCPRVPLELDEAKAAIEFTIYPHEGKNEYHCAFRSSLYSEDFIRGFLTVYDQVLLSFLKVERLSDVALTDKKTEALLDSFNATQKDYPVTDIVSLFRAQAEANPALPAVVYKDETWTYAQVDDLTDRIAGYLRSLGLGREKVVSILIPRCSFMAAASLGVLKSGAAYQPLDPTYPNDRLAFMMKDADCKLLIADESLLNKVPDYKGPVLLTKDIPALPKCEKLTDHPAPEDLFILLYTSGSTGVPKGVMLEHRNLANFCAWYRSFYHLDNTSRVAAYASYGFDACMMDMYPALTTGASVYVVEEEIRLDLLSLEKYFNERGITHSFMTTQVGRQFYSMTGTDRLKYLSVGGEKLVPLPPKDGNPVFINGYGPTECTIFSTVQLVDRLYDRVPIGRPLDNYKCYVIDEHGHRMPPLVPGELLIAGRGVGRGYLNRPDLSAKAFIRNPFDEGKDAVRAYRTGDVVRLLPDGRIDFIGRNDGQVKVRGFRIELTEVEAVIREFPGITDATVQAFEDESSGEKYIAAYVVSPETVDVSAMNEFIRERKPPYMVPSVTMQLDSIPLNQNQKVNKKALPRPQRQKDETIPPQNEVQQKIFDCVADVVGHRDFGITTDFYEAGLSSIGAIRLNVLLSKAFDAVVSSRDLKENNTVDKMESFLTGGKAVKETYDVRPDYGLTKTQEGVYVESIAKPQDTVYNVPILLEISDELDTDRLKAAIVAAVNAHPILKTRMFLDEDGNVRMRRMDGDFSFDEAAVTERRIESIEEEKTKLIKPFRLLGGRLFRVELLHGEKTWLFIEVHHIIADGSSLSILLRDISDAYAGRVPETEHYTGYEVVLNEEKLREGPAFDRAKQYYENLLDDTETNSLPSGDVFGETEAVTRLLEQDASTIAASEAKEWCTKQHVSMNGLFSAAFGLVLNKYLGTESAAFAGIYSGRNDSRLADTVAMLVKTLPIVVNLRSGKTTAQFVKEISQQLVDSQSNDIYSFAEISRSLHVNAEVMFAWQGDEFTFDSLCGKPARLVSVTLSEAKAPMNLNANLDGDRIHFTMEYRGDRFSEDYMRGFLASLETALTGLVHREWLSEVSILSDRAKETLRHFNDTALEGPRPTAPELFCAAAKTYADETAVIARSGQVRLTYRELWARARKLAGILIEKGVHANDRVALYMDRTEDVYAVREGILLSGGAFVSLEPDYPDDRISFILRDAGITRLITSKDLLAQREALFTGQETPLEILFTEDLFGQTGVEAACDLPVSIDPDSAAYCIYTSGSTGRPKGVEILHKNLANLLDYNEKNILAKAYVDNSTIWLALAAITFDVSVIEEMMPMFHGRAVSIATQEEIHNPLLLMRMVKKTGVDMMKCTPSYLQSILDVPEARDALCGLKALIVGAEPFPDALYPRIREAGFNGILFNSYGPTETCVSVSIGKMEGKRTTIGGPTLNTVFQIRDSFGNTLPPYARGELIIAGAQVARGYVNLPEMTRDKFITIQVDDQSMPAYRSGDVAFFDGSGEIVHCGRNDNQVKIRGLRIELDGIENVMNSFPGIKRSVVLVKGEGDGRFLCGYYVSPKPVDEAALISHLKETLTAYMIPSVFVHLTELPMTVNGKVNKRALPEPQFRQKVRSQKAATSALQQKIAAMFAKALGVDSVGVDEDFFEIGGTSMLASKVAMQAMVAGLPIAYQDIFANTTVEALEKSVLAKGHGGEPHKDTAAEPVEEAQEQKEDPAIRPALEYNTMAHIKEISSESLGDVLLTGATGFLGIHVLKELIENTDGKITCLIRRGQSETPRRRLESMLVYYFETNMKDVFESGRLKTVDGDLTDRELVLAQDGLSFKTVINCAACVKHFASDDILERVNVEGVRNLIELCEKTGSRLIQISTVSVAGENVNHALPDTLVMRENMLSFGQDLSNQYIHSKYKAEKLILKEIASGKLKAKIIRVGNLMSRDSDGEFQVNYVTSGFMRNLKGYAAIGAYPVSGMAHPIEFSPIDLVAQSVRLLAGTPDRFTVFHAVNGHWIEMGDVVAAMNAAGIDVEVVDEETFSTRLSEAMKDESKNMLVAGLISYLSSDADTVRSYVPEEHTFTKNALYRLGYRWPLTDERYLRNAIEALDSLGFFDGED